MAGPPYGLVPTGFNPKSQEAALADMQAKQLAGISPSLDLQPTSILGVLNGIVSAAVAEGWEVAAANYNGMDPDQATDDQLTGVSLITGTERDGSEKTQVPGCVVNVDAGFSAAAGTMFASVVGNPVALFTNKEDVSNPGGAPANVTVDFEAVNAGPIQCLVATLTVRQQALSGWNTVNNPTAGVIGHDTEGDPSLRLRRSEELSAAGSATAAALKGDILRNLQPDSVATPVSSPTLNCTVLWNDKDVVDGNGLPPHSLEAIAYQPGNTTDDDQTLAQFILDFKSAGINTFGLASKTATDSQGESEVIFYTRPTTVNVYIAITVKVNPKTFPGDGSAQISALIQGYAGLAWEPGVTVYALATRSVVIPRPEIPGSGITGVIDVPTFLIDTVNAPVASANIPIGVRQIAKVAGIVVTVTS